MKVCGNPCTARVKKGEGCQADRREADTSAQEYKSPYLAQIRQQLELTSYPTLSSALSNSDPTAVQPFLTPIGLPAAVSEG